MSSLVPTNAAFHHWHYARQTMESCMGTSWGTRLEISDFVYKLQAHTHLPQAARGFITVRSGHQVYQNG